MLGQMLLVSSTVCQMVSNSHIDSFIDTNCVMLCVVHLQGLDSDIFIVESSWESNALVLARCISMVVVDPWTFIPNKRETNMETKLLKVRHMSRPIFFYLANWSLFEPGAFKRVWPPHYNCWFKFSCRIYHLIKSHFSIVHTSDNPPVRSNVGLSSGCFIYYYPARTPQLELEIIILFKSLLRSEYSAASSPEY